MPDYLLRCRRFAPTCAGSENRFRCSLEDKPKSWTMATVFPSGVQCQLLVWWNDPFRFRTLRGVFVTWHVFACWFYFHNCVFLVTLQINTLFAIFSIKFVKRCDIVGDQAMQRLNVPTAHLRPPWFTSESRSRIQRCFTIRLIAQNWWPDRFAANGSIIAMKPNCMISEWVNHYVQPQTNIIHILKQCAGISAVLSNVPLSKFWQISLTGGWSSFYQQGSIYLLSKNP